MRAVPYGNDDRVAKVWRLVTNRAAAGGHAVSLSHVCAAAVLAASVDGAALSVVTRTDRRSLVYASDGLAGLLDDQQFSLGEGPCVEGWSSGGLVLAGDLADSFVAARWPLFAPVALAAGVRAMFGFPLQMGAIRLGTLGLYRRQAGTLDREQLADVLTLCSAAVAMMLSATTQPLNGVDSPGRIHPSWLPGAPGDRTIEVYQATGMVAVQLGVGLEDAFAALRARAFAGGITLPELARQVVDRRLRFETDDLDQD